MSPTSVTDPAAVRAALAAPFPADVVQCRPGPVSKDGKMAGVLWYIDARAVMDRLDDVLGIFGWKDEYKTDLDKKMVTCRLWFKNAGGEWHFHEDVGGESDQPDEGDRHKAAYSDALKRTAVKLGVGRYLYEVPFFQHPLSQHGRYFDRQNLPKMPAQFLPRPAESPAVKSKKAADWAVTQYAAAKTRADVLKVDGVIADRKGTEVMLPPDLARADAARREAQLRAKDE